MSHTLSIRPARPSLVAGALAIGLAATSIGALLADLYGIVSMATFFWWITVPSLLALSLLAVAPLPSISSVQERVRVGAVAGVAGIIGYDVVRIPFVMMGQRLLAPIDSYGLLLSGGRMATPWSNTLGWLFHLSNGVTFGIVYAVVAARRHWAWGVVWGVTLESAVVFSPFLERYALAGKYGSIALAYGAHVAFGYPLGRLVQRFDRTRDELYSVFRRPALAVLGLSVVVLLVWHHPWTESPARRAASAVAARTGHTAVVVTHDRFIPEWVRVEQGACVHIVNRTATSFTTKFGAVPANADSDLCFAAGSARVVRVQLSGTAYSGGFVLVENR